MSKLLHYITIAPSFIGGALLAPGSRVTSDDLGTYLDAKTGEEKQVTAGSTLVEVDELGRPMTKEGALELHGVVIDQGLQPIAAISPFAPNPTRAQGAPAQPPGGLQIAENDMRTAPADGVESDAAAAARSEQADNAAALTAQLGGVRGGAPRAEAPTRRTGTRRAPAKAAAKPTGKQAEAIGADGGGSGNDSGEGAS